MFNPLGRLFDFNAQAIKKLMPVVARVNELEPQFKKVKDRQFPEWTERLRKRLGKGERLEEMLPEALALIREAICRVVGQRAFDVQVMAAAVLHQGKIAEQKTGEGKTLAAAMAAYVNALTGRGVHVVTVNDYLARRDTGWYGQALALAGLSLGCIIHEQAFGLDLSFDNKEVSDEKLRHLRSISRREAYAADVTYGTNNEYGFDYLRDNMVRQLADKVQRRHHFAIVDEADSILIDEARTPLIISAPDTEPTQKYYDFAKLIQNLTGETDFTVDEKLKIANLTEHGIKKVEKILGVENLYEKDFDTIHHIENALRARTLFLRDKDYVIKEGQVIIVDEFTGRLMFGRRWSDGLHQAVEAKEGVAIQQESITLATISFQNYFRLYHKLAGMTGTAVTEAEEFNKIYNLEVVVIPTNRPMIRQDLADVIYKTAPLKYAAVVKEIGEYYAKGQPVLVGTTSIEKNEIIDRFLTKKKIPHQVLNAKQHEKEAQIIAQAGRLKAVTVATNMAGRGVDIILGGSPVGRPEREWQKEHAAVVRLGGLHVMGTERHESRRIDNQLRGRSGRQGDPGSSRFFISLDDEIMRLFGGEQIKKAMEFLKIPEDQPIEHRMISKSIEQAQVKVEGFNFDRRKQVVEYDDVMNKQREIIYKRRNQILMGEGSLREEILGKMKTNWREWEEIVPFDDRSRREIKKRMEGLASEGECQALGEKILSDIYDQREKQVGGSVMREMERFVYLMSIDRLWVDHLDMMDDLREGIGLRGYGQQDPLVEYKKEAYASFERLMGAIDGEVVRRLFRVQAGPMLPPTMPVEVQTNVDVTDKMGLAQKPVVRKNKIGRNDPCWCGSGKKWKRCHYPQVG
jgi:preprotein translocase subunit SecA